MSPSPSSSDSSSSRPLRNPWSHIVRGESDAIPAAPSSPPSASPIPCSEPSDRSPPKPAPKPADDVAGSSETEDHSINDNATTNAASSSGGRKTAWSRPSNGSMGASAVMGAHSWPALSESTRVGPKLPSSDSLKSSVDESVPAPPGPVIATPQLKPQTNTSNNPNPNYNRQKATKRGGSATAVPVNGGPISIPLPSPAAVELPHISPEKPSGQGQEPSPRDPPKNNSGNWDQGSSSRAGSFLPQSHGGPDHPRPYNRRGNNGGGGSHNGGRRDPDRGGYDWNNPPPRHMVPMPPPLHQQRGHHPRPPFMRPHPPPPASPAAPFMGVPPPGRPFVGPPMGFAEIHSSMYYYTARPPAFVPHPVTHAGPHAMFLSQAEHQRALLVKQIEYYFSADNLCKDVFLRQQMDDNGWVLVSLIATFNRVKQCTDHITNKVKYILDSIRTSEVVEVQGEKIRKRGDWMNWIIPPQPIRYASVSGAQSSATSSYGNLVHRMHNVGLGEELSNHNSTGGATQAVSGGGLNGHAAGNSDADS